MLKLRNIIRYSTGKEKIITLAFLIIMLSFVNIINTSALSLKSSNTLEFTFNPTVTITISPVSGGSSSNLLIDNLAAGNSDVSNAINIDIATNTLYGISLDATVGSSSIAAENVTNLNHTGTASNSKFTSIATDANLASLTTANTWGYATSTNSGSDWSNYNGLPAYNAATPANILDVTPDPYAEPSNGSIQFRIGAKAGGSQTSGSYTNTINFTAVTKPMVTSYNIVYHDNSEAGSNIPSDQSGTINTDSANVALSSTVPTRSGYIFAGWCTVSTNDDTCTGSIYQAGANYPFSNVGGIVNVNLYAMWRKTGTAEVGTDEVENVEISCDNNCPVTGTFNGELSVDEEEFIYYLMESGESLNTTLGLNYVYDNSGNLTVFNCDLSMDSVLEAAEIALEGYDDPDYGDVHLRMRLPTSYEGYRVFVIFVDTEEFSEAIAFETTPDSDDDSLPIVMSPEVAEQLSDRSWLVLVGTY